MTCVELNDFKNLMVDLDVVFKRGARSVRKVRRGEFFFSCVDLLKGFFLNAGEALNIDFADLLQSTVDGF